MVRLLLFTIQEHITDMVTPGEFNVKPRKKDMWTEVTKDLVIREAIDQCGYSCEETDDFFYIMEYLKYVRCGVQLEITRR